MSEQIKSEFTHGKDVRLECIRLSYRHDRDPVLIIERAAALEDYVLKGKQPAGKPAKVNKPGGPDLTQQS